MREKENGKPPPGDFWLSRTEPRSREPCYKRAWLFSLENFFWKTNQIAGSGGWRYTAGMGVRIRVGADMYDWRGH